MLDSNERAWFCRPVAGHSPNGAFTYFSNMSKNSSKRKSPDILSNVRGSYIIWYFNLPLLVYLLLRWTPNRRSTWSTSTIKLTTKSFRTWWKAFTDVNAQIMHLFILFNLTFELFIKVHIRSKLNSPKMIPSCLFIIQRNSQKVYSPTDYLFISECKGNNKDARKQNFSHLFKLF